MRNKRKKVDGEKLFSIIATVTIVAALVVGIVTIAKSAGARKNRNYIDLNNVQSTKNTEETKKQVVENRETEPVTETLPVVESEPATEPATEERLPASVVETEPPVDVNAIVYSFSESSSLLWPVEGSVVLGYNMDNTIYFPTLEQYQCNPAIIISAQVDSQVMCSAKGVVEDVYEDAVTGTTMVISVGDGYELHYGQLKDLKVGVGDDVEVGTVIGSVASPTKYFTVEGSNLYFKLTKDGEPVDPTIHLIMEK